MYSEVWVKLNNKDGNFHFRPVLLGTLTCGEHHFRFCQPTCCLAGPPQSVAFTYNWEHFFFLISYTVLFIFCPRLSLTSWLWTTHRYPLSVHMFVKPWCEGVNAPWNESWSEKSRNDRQLKCFSLFRRNPPIQKVKCILKFPLIYCVPIFHVCFLSSCSTFEHSYTPLF